MQGLHQALQNHQLLPLLIDFFQLETQVFLTKKVLWSQEEIDELSGNLKRLVQSSQNKINTDIIERLHGIERNLLDKKKTEV